METNRTATFVTFEPEPRPWCEPHIYIIRKKLVKVFIIVKVNNYSDKYIFLGKSKCLPIILYDIEAVLAKAADVKYIELAVSRAFMLNIQCLFCRSCQRL